MPVDLQDLLDSARAAAVVVTHLRDEGIVSEASATKKKDGSLETIADVIGQDVIRRMLFNADEKVLFLGEEDQAHADVATLAIGTRLFVVDPIDGTKCFLLCQPTDILTKKAWSVSVAYVEVAKDENEHRILSTLSAVVYAPDAHSLYYADAGTAMVQQRGRERALRIQEKRDTPIVTFYCKKLENDSDPTKQRIAALNKAVNDAIESGRYQSDPWKGSPALSLAMAADRPNNIVVTRESDPFSSAASTGVPAWDTLAGGFIYERAGGVGPDREAKYINIGELTFSIIAPSRLHANDMLEFLRRVP
jgi:fructose-1,6-bisphosphatase/inositol monophosphatase family enzyme